MYVYMLYPNELTCCRCVPVTKDARRHWLPVSGVTWWCELSDVSVGNLTRVLCKSTMCSYLLNCPFNLFKTCFDFTF